MLKTTLPNKSLILVQGQDANNFLQNILTNDISEQYHLLLTPRGKILYDFFLFPTLEGYLIEVFSEAMEELFNILNKYTLNRNIYFKPIHHLFPNIMISNNSLIKGYDNNDVFHQSFYDEYLKFCFDNKIPLWGLDFLPEDFFPFELDMDRLNAVSYTKGCYLGQEMVTKAKFGFFETKTLKKIFLDSDQNYYNKPLFTDQNEKIGKILGNHQNGWYLATVKTNITQVYCDNVSYKLYAIDA